MHSALEKLSSSRNSEKTIHQCVATAFKLQKEFKLVVYAIEMFIKKSKVDDKLGGLFVLDALCRESRSRYGKDKDVFSNRFKLRIKETITFLDRVSVKDKVRFYRIGALYVLNLNATITITITDRDRSGDRRMEEVRYIPKRPAERFQV